jgi:hypothetical protein
MSWRIRGSYFESCNCDAICPCRKINGVPGGRSTHGECMGVLSWMIEEGAADDVDLSGLPVAMAVRYSDDEPGSPWTWVLYLDARASDEQRGALEGIWCGRLGGDALTHFPWARKASELSPSGRSRSRGGFQRPGSESTQRPHPRPPRFGDESYCIIPLRASFAGEELVTDELRVEDERLRFSPHRHVRLWRDVRLRGLLSVSGCERYDRSNVPTLPRLTPASSAIAAIHAGDVGFGTTLQDEPELASARTSALLGTR